MKILYTINSGQYGGMELHVLDLCEGLLKKGYEIHVWCPEGPISKELSDLGIKVILREVNVTWGIDIDPKYISELVKYLKKEKFDVVHTHGLRAMANTLLAGFLAGQKNLISHIHTPFSTWSVPGWKRLLYSKSLALAVFLFSRYEIALTESVRQTKVGEWLLPGKLKIVQPGNAVRFDKFKDAILSEDAKREMSEKYHFPLDKKIILCLGRISEEKGHALILEAYSGLEKEVTLVFAGGGPLEETFKNKGAYITGRFDEKDKEKLYMCADIFVHPTFAEGWGIVPAEALFLERTVLVSDLEVIKDVLKDYPFYFKVGSLEDLRKQLKQLLNTDSKKPSAKKFIRNNYSLEKFAEAYDIFYKNL